MDPQIQTVIDEIAHLADMQEMMMQEDREFVSDDDKVLAVGAEGAYYIYELCQRINAKNILEIGTSHGYSTLFFADVVKKNNGKVITLEKRPSKIAFAKKNFEKAGVSKFVDIIEGNAKESISSLQGLFDLVFIDARKDEYVDYFKLVLPKVRIGGFIVADNIFRPRSSREHMVSYQQYVKLLSNIKSETVQVGNGLEVSEKISD